MEMKFQSTMDSIMISLASQENVTVDISETIRIQDEIRTDMQQYNIEKQKMAVSSEKELSNLVLTA